MKRIFWTVAGLALAIGQNAQGAPPAAGGPAPTPAVHPVPSPPPPSPAELAAPPADALRLSGGIAYKVLVPGTGKIHPTPEDIVEFHAIGRTPEGMVFQDSFSEGKPKRFQLRASFDAWKVAVGEMVAGETTRFWFPRGALPRDPKSGASGAGVFDIALLDVASLPPRPQSLTTPDPKAKKTPHGGAYRVLKAGNGKSKIGLHDGALVRYTAWRASDGLAFDSWLRDKKPTLFPVDKVMPALGDCLLGMTEHEERLCWIPAEGNSGFPTQPTGALVFRLELEKNLDVGQLLAGKGVQLPPPSAAPPGP